MAQIKIKKTELEKVGTEIFKSYGVSDKDAELVVDNLIHADLCGLSSHGMMRVMPYVQRIKDGFTNVKPDIHCVKVADSMFKIDADNALGQVVTMYAMEKCVAQASKTGMAAASVNHMNHLGMASYYTKYAAKKGMLAFLCTNASPTMAPFGGLDCLLGTNPFSVSFDAGKYDNFTLDVATTATARGKIRMYQKEGKKLPKGWALDKDGNDTTDPTAALEGSLLPMGAHKGYGLAMIMDELSGVFAGGDLSYEAESMFDSSRPANTGCFITVLDIYRFVDPGTFRTRNEAWMDRIKASKTRPGFDEVFLPGEIENRRLANAGDEVSLLDKTWEELQALRP